MHQRCKNCRKWFRSKRKAFYCCHKCSEQYRALQKELEREERITVRDPRRDFGRNGYHE